MIKYIEYKGVKIEVWIDRDWDNLPYAEKIYSKPEQNLVGIISDNDLERIEEICRKP